MHYKCVECGHIFEKGEQAVWKERHGLSCGPYQKWSGCPICKGEYKAVSRCKRCDELVDGPYFGYCEDCIFDLLDYENAFDYLKEKKVLRYFFFDRIFQTDEPSRPSKELDEELELIFKRKRIDDLIFQKKTFLEKLKDFISEDTYDFADFLKERGEIE